MTYAWNVIENGVRRPVCGAFQCMRLGVAALHCFATGHVDTVTKVNNNDFVYSQACR